jgi:hypothetical protein
MSAELFGWMPEEGLEPPTNADYDSRQLWLSYQGIRGQLDTPLDTTAASAARHSACPRRREHGSG